MDHKKIYKILAKDNSYNFNIVKTIEELGELSTALSQHLTKGTNLDDIIEEVGDVKLRLKVLDKLLGSEYKQKVKERIKNKAEQLINTNKLTPIGKDLHNEKHKYTV
jgi:NTP pyrophosphatase (non-canonical NTP hydrolase)